MPVLQPFAAIRPPRALAALVSTRSYLTYSEEELAQKLATNPFSLLHVLNRRGASKDSRFVPVREGYEAFLAEGHLAQDEAPHLYVYQQDWDGHVYTGILGLISLEDYRAGRIIKHENTIAKREKLFARYLKTVGFHAEPVLLARSTHAGWDTLLASVTAKRPETEFATADGAIHKLWMLNATESEELQNFAAELPAFYVADGHHRLASSDRVEETDGVMAFVLCESQLRIAPFHRFVKNKGGVNWAEALHAVQLAERPTSLPAQGLYALDAAGWWHVPAPGLGFPESGWVYEHILKPLWQVEDERSDERVRYEPGTMELEELERQRKSSEVVFVLPAPQWTDVKEGADRGLNLPPKSTYIEPKLRSGITLFAWK